MKATKKKEPAGRVSRQTPISAFLLEALETELGGVDVYRTALECARNEDVREEWQKYLEETKEHVAALTEVCKAFGLDPAEDTPGRQVVRLIGKSLVKAMQVALGSVPPNAAEIVAAECVVHAETKDHMNWTLLKKAAEKQTGRGADALRAACAKYEDQEDAHLYHNQGWARELTKAALGLDAALPPPEEEKDVRTAVGAARAQAHGNEGNSARRQPKGRTAHAS
jgi:rubrerythrin